MQIVIDIPGEMRKLIMDGVYCGISDKRLYEAIRNGVSLPAEHGRLIDADELRCENTDFDTYNDYCIMFDEIAMADTVIEPYKAEGSEDKE